MQYQNAGNNVDVSVVIPVYNSEDCLFELYQRLTSTLGDYVKKYEIIFINDCSTDQSWEKIVELCEKDKKINGICLRKNFGQDSAIMAGLNNVCGGKIVIMDDDLQHDPAYIPLLLEKLESGYDVCYALFETKRQSRFKNFGSWLNGKIAEIVFNKPKNIYLSPFKAITREIADELIKYDGPHPYMDGLLFRITHNITQVPVKHFRRQSGKGHYTLMRSLQVWSRMATNFSVFPLRASLVFGFIASIIGFLMAIYFIIERILFAQPMGWASLMVSLLFLGGILLIAVGIVGEYVGRLFLHISKEPQFIISHFTKKPEE